MSVQRFRPTIVDANCVSVRQAKELVPNGMIREESVPISDADATIHEESVPVPDANAVIREESVLDAVIRLHIRRQAVEAIKTLSNLWKKKILLVS